MYIKISQRPMLVCLNPNFLHADKVIYANEYNFIPLDLLEIL